MSAGELILYRSEDGRAEIHLRAEGDTVWLTQAEMAELFDTTPQAVTQHIRAIYEEGELTLEATCKESLQVRQEGQRRVQRRLKVYSLPMILAVGYRVRSSRGTQFRQWATAHLEEYLVKGFVMDDQRLKEPGGWDYFDELLERIRDIRASEKRFYQKVKDLFALSSDYRPDDRDTQLFFAEVQNKLLFAVTGHTAAEIVVERANPNEPNMALTSWKGARVRKQDVTISKNYLTADEVDTLNRLVVIFLEQAELRAKARQDLTLDYWRQNVDRLLEFNERPVLEGAGAISSERARQVAHERFEQFDAQRRRDEALEADAEDLRELEALEKQVKKEDKS
ncbi:virulence RhuM family protein [Halomonas beimenensis]|uniref:Putative DNA-binding protein in cluster with Type I restriction-modification system n=1 Tax=Halomonas beimenensis TaxID=475662 RepID=A0A291P3U9_9GAMM|nr:virulence RhuM family protein [Halomonas beimenensis]ATJ81535.1 putative DNA-binding protein in cluster with Type I restriction-modification system [Halomonas beimenensis]